MKKRGNPINVDWLFQGKPSAIATYSENIPRYLAGGNLSALTTQVMTSVALPLQAGDIVTNLTFVSATTAASAPTNWWFALYDDSATPALIAQTADQTSGAWAANTPKTLALSAPYAVTRPGIFYAAIMVKATTPPTLSGLDCRNAVVTSTTASTPLAAVVTLAQTSGSSLTTTAPATITSSTAASVVPYVIAS